MPENADLPPITVRQIDAILPFLNRFEAVDFSVGEWKMPKGQFPCEGYLASMFENGHIVALLRRLKAIRAEMETKGGPP
jgi:hypothetical protein